MGKNDEAEAIEKQMATQKVISSPFKLCFMTLNVRFLPFPVGWCSSGCQSRSSSKCTTILSTNGCLRTIPAVLWSSSISRLSRRTNTSATRTTSTSSTSFRRLKISIYCCSVSTNYNFMSFFPFSRSVLCIRSVFYLIKLNI